MNTLTREQEIITSSTQLTEIFKKGIKQSQKLGVEFEKIPINEKTFKCIEFFFKNGMLDFLTKLQKSEKLVPYYENNIMLGLFSNQGAITLEPGAQIEYSIKPKDYIAEIESELDTYNIRTGQIAKEMGIKFLSLGIQPISTYSEIKIIPKSRYSFMTKYLKEQASLPYVMMRETAGIQVSIDYSSEEDAIKKLSTALKLSPFLCAFFANSPIRNGKLTEYKSFRAKAWLNTDNKRCGLISKNLFKKNIEFNFDDYAQILLDLPMIFNRKNYLGNKTFREFLNNNQAVVSDWETHLSLFFPDARLKNYIEIRNHDCQKKEIALAIPAIYKGIMYSPNSIEKINELLKEFNYFDFEFVRHNGPRFGLDFSVKNKKIKNIVFEIVNIAQEGLKSFNQGEEKYIEPVLELLKDNVTPADIIIKNFEGSWKKNISKLIKYSEIR